VEVVASLSQGRTAAAQCGFFTYKSVPVIFEPPCNSPKFSALDSALLFYYSRISLGVFDANILNPLGLLPA